MKIAWIGLGKLGYPCALTLQHAAGHEVVGYDVHRERIEHLQADPGDHGEQGLGEMMQHGPLKLAHSVGEAVAHGDVVFVAVQTPHAPAYGGEQPMPAERRDFEYGYLIQAVRDVCRAAAGQAKPITLVVVSTVLPGTVNKHIRGLLNGYVSLVYSPLFIAMGTTISDFIAPEFVLMGADQPEALGPVVEVYARLHDRPVFKTSIESAELIKVAYNTFISMKIVWANTMMELCHKTGADCDAVVDALSMATDRIISPAYMRGGMGDGGHCHPRDLIALADISQRLDVSADLFAYLAKAREEQSEWLAGLVAQWAGLADLPVMVLGQSYKPRSALTGGSPAILLRHHLEGLRYSQADAFRQQVEVFDSYVDPFVDPLLGPAEPHLSEPHVYVVATRHPEFATYAYPPGSVVLDPHGYIPDQPGVTVVRIGRKS